MRKLTNIILTLLLLGIFLLAGPYNAKAVGSKVAVDVKATFDSGNSDVTLLEDFVTYGSDIVVDLKEQVGYEFAFWIVDGIVRTDLTAKDNTFVATNDLSVVAVHNPATKDLVSLHAVVFVDHSGKLIETKYVPTGSVTEPEPATLPDKVGYVHGNPKWTSITGSTTLDNITTNTVFKLNYEKDLEVESINITVNDAIENYMYNDIVTVKTDLVGFTHWEEDGKVVSYSKEYSFSALYNRKLTPMTKGTIKPLITISKDLEMRASYVSKVAQVELPEG